MQRTDFEIQPVGDKPLKRFRFQIRKYMASMIVLIVFLLIAVWTLLTGLFLEPGNELGYCLLFLYVILPTTSCGCTLVLALLNKRSKWVMPLLCGIYVELLVYVMFGYMSLFDLCFSFVPAVVGLIIGLFTCWMTKKSNGWVQKQ